MIDVQDLVKTFGPTRAVDGVTFSADQGEILGFLGPNGAGKTSTMRMLTCFFPPDAGTATVAGHDVFQDSLEVRRRIGYLPEHPPLYPDMTVRGYLAFAARIKGVARSRLAERLEFVVEACGLAPVFPRLIGHCSRGFRQRIGLAQALIHDPEVLILDEPTVGLDPKQIAEIRHLIKSLEGERTIILSTHILPEVEMTCHRVVIIDAGRVVAVDTAEALAARYRGAPRLVVQVRTPPEGITEALLQVDGVTAVRPGPEPGTYELDTADRRDRRADLAAFIVDRGWGLQELRQVRVTLEDIFLHLTTEEPAPETDP